MSNKKSELLGENFGRANGKLRKAILFSLVKELGKDLCFRCTLKIKDINQFSIEHKESWQNADNPIKAFYQLKNIAFSHLSCNVRVAVKIHKIHRNKEERRAVHWRKYYAKNKDILLLKKRQRYHNNKSLGVV